MSNVLFQPYPSKVYILDQELGIRKLTIIEDENIPLQVSAIADYLPQVYISDSKIVRKYYSFLCSGMLFEISINVEKSLILREISKKFWSEDRDQLEDKFAAQTRQAIYNTMLEYSSYLPENVVNEIIKLAEEDNKKIL